MKLILAILFAILTIGGGVYLLSQTDGNLGILPVPGTGNGSREETVSKVIPTENPQGITTIATGLDTPWAIAILPDQSMLVTERPGRLRYITASGSLDETPAEGLPSVTERGEGGLLGLTLHPKFAENHYVYLYYTYSGQGSQTMNRVSRMTYENNRLTGEMVIVDQIPGSSNHNGGRIHFGPDGNLYIGTGDAEEPSEAQNTKSLAGKILRVDEVGRIPSDNPFGNAVYSYGHRNVQGLTWDGSGNLWATEHGRSGVSSGLDEVNLIQKGKNYGWPEIEGSETRSGMETAKRNSGTTTWAPSGATFLGSSLYFSGLRGRSLYEAVLSGQSVSDFREHMTGEFGRIREVILGPDEMLYISTSNRDGRGVPGDGDDRIIRINPSKL